MEGNTEQPGRNKEARLEIYEAKLWQRANEISDKRNNKEERRNELFKESRKIRNSRSNTDKVRLQDIDEEYWRLNQEIKNLFTEEDTIQELLLGVSEGKPDLVALQEMFPPEEPKKLSKKKQRIQDEIDRLGYDPRNGYQGALDLGLPDSSTINPVHLKKVAGSNPQRVTTGAGQTGIKGNFNPLDGPEIFFASTSDTHGGKARKKSSSNSFTTKGGKRIRKR